MDSTIFLAGDLTVVEVESALRAWSAANPGTDVELRAVASEDLPGYQFTVDVAADWGVPIEDVTGLIASHLASTTGAQVKTEFEAEAEYRAKLRAKRVRTA